MSISKISCDHSIDLIWNQTEEQILKNASESVYVHISQSVLSSTADSISSSISDAVYFFMRAYENT